MTERPAHDEDCELFNTRLERERSCACSYRASLVKLEREREEDRAAIRALKDACDEYMGGDCTCLNVLRPYVAAIQRAQERP